MDFIKMNIEDFEIMRISTRLIIILRDREVIYLKQICRKGKKLSRGNFLKTPNFRHKSAF